MSEGSIPSRQYIMIYRWETEQSCKQLIDWKVNYVNYPSQRYDITGNVVLCRELDPTSLLRF
jgi:hypothetical protein